MQLQLSVTITTEEKGDSTACLEEKTAKLYIKICDIKQNLVVI